MLKVYLFILLLIPLVQNSSRRFYVDRVVVNGGYDAKYIFRRQNVILPPDKLVTKTDVACFLNELKETGLIKDMRIRMQQRTDDTRTVILTPLYHREIRHFVISEITLDGLPEVNEVKFRALLEEKGVSPGIPLLKYYYSGLEERINQSLTEALPLDLSHQYQGSAWITIRPAGHRKVELIVSASYPGCGEASGYPPEVHPQRTGH